MCCLISFGPTPPKNTTQEQYPHFLFLPLSPQSWLLNSHHPGGPPAQGPCPLSAEAPIPGPLLRAPAWRHHRKGHLTPSPRLAPSPLCTSALGLDWALGQKLLHGPGDTGHRPTPTTHLSQRACLLPGALLAFVREQGTGSKAPGCLPSVPSFRTCLPLQRPGLPVRLGSRRAVGLPHTLPHPHPSLFPALGVSQKLVLTLPPTLIQR